MRSRREVLLVASDLDPTDDALLLSSVRGRVVTSERERFGVRVSRGKTILSVRPFGGEIARERYGQVG